MASTLQPTPTTPRDAPPARPARRVTWAWLGVAPFLLFAVFFLFLPSMALFVGNFQDNQGHFTLANIAGLFTPSLLSANGGRPPRTWAQPAGNIGATWGCRCCCPRCSAR